MRARGDLDREPYVTSVTGTARMSRLFPALYWFDRTPKNSRGRAFHWAGVWTVLAAVSLLYVFLGTAGTFAELPGQSDSYDRMAEGFRAGHLYIEETPSRALLAKDDPYADKYTGLGLWDASLYGGRYYLYWGPVPALFVIAFKTITAFPRAVSDQWLTLIFMLGRFYAGAALILALCRMRVVSPPSWAVALAVGVFGLAGPSPFIVARPQVYEASLAAGQCFLLWGLWAALRGFFSSERRTSWFVLAGCAWALAMGSRVTTWIAIPALVSITLVTSWLRSRAANATRRAAIVQLARESLAIGTPVAAAAIAYAIYNQARFDSFTEFGVSYQITLQKFWRHESFVWPNLVSYLWAPLDWSCQFPFAGATANRAAPFFLRWPPGYQIFEKVSGVLVMAPWCYLLLVSVARLARRAWVRVRMGAAASSPGMCSLELWAVLCSLSLLPTIVPALGLWEASMRYSADALGGAVLAASLGAFWLLRRDTAAKSAGVRAQLRILVAGLGAYTCLVGAFSGVPSYQNTLRDYNPELYRRIEAALSVCAPER
jgi:hypothetical protein